MPIALLKTNLVLTKAHTQILTFNTYTYIIHHVIQQLSRKTEIFYLLYICHILQSEVHEDSCDDGHCHGDHGADRESRGGVALVRGARVDAGPVLLKTAASGEDSD